MEKVPMTAEGYRVLDEQLKQLKQVERPSVIAAISEAREHGELDKYRESKRLNVLCKEAIEQSIRGNYKDNRLDADAVWRDVTAQFGPERTAFVLGEIFRSTSFGSIL